MENIILLKNIEYFGNKYTDEHVFKYNKVELENNWWEALKFFYSKSFMRGRKDKLSHEYLEFTLSVLEEFKNGDDLDGFYDKLKAMVSDIEKNKDLKKMFMDKGKVDNDVIYKTAKKSELINKLKTKKNIEIEYEKEKYKKYIHLGNILDIKMTLGVLKFVTNTDIKRKNIFKYVLDGIEEGNVEKIYKELDGIIGIGDKISTFVIRDIMLLAEMNFYSQKDGSKLYKYAFPVDTWVAQLAKTFNKEINTDKLDEVKEEMLNICFNNKINPLEFAAGLWYVGANSLDILMTEFLGKYKISN